MEQNLNEQQTSVAEVQTTEPAKQNSQRKMRIFVMILIVLADIAFAASMAYVLFLLITWALGVDISPFFGGELFDATLGGIGALGILLILILVGIAALIIAVGTVLINITKKFYNLLKFANEQNMDIVIAKKTVASYLIGMICFTLVIAFFAFTMIINNLFNIFAILIYISTVLCILALIVSIIHLCINRSKINKLEPDEQEKIEEQCKEFNKKFEKKETRKTTGKLY